MYKPIIDYHDCYWCITLTNGDYTSKMDSLYVKKIVDTNNNSGAKMYMKIIVLNWIIFLRG